MIKTKRTKRILFTLLGIVAVGLLANFGLNTKNVEATWSPGDWINQSFWDWNPSDGNIIYALYGDGTPWSSPYNQYWTNGCLPTNVIHTSTIPTTTNNNTVYVLASWNYNISSTIVMGQCSTLISKWWNSIIKSNNVNWIWIAQSNTIIDGIKLEWLWALDTNYWILVINSSNTTINNSDLSKNEAWIRVEWSLNTTINNTRIHDNNLYGIHLLNNSDSNYILNSQIYNQGWNNDVGVQIDSSNNNTMNNSHVFNNYFWIESNGVGSFFWCSTTTNNSVNNSQIYNNSWGIMWLCNKYTIQNSSIYNNIYGIGWLHLRGFLNNVDIYNNLGGYVVLGIMTGYWDINFFDNTSALISGDFLKLWTSSPVGVSWAPGSKNFYTGIMSKYRITNPISNNWDKLIDTFTNWTGNRWVLWWLDEEPTKYVIWKNILKQIKPVRYNSGWDLEEFWIAWKDYDTEKYIAEVQMELSAEDEALVEYYYWDESEFTANWNENNCSLWAFTVEYIDWYAELSANLLVSDPIWHTIYVLSWESFDLPSSMAITIGDSCIALVTESTWLELVRAEANGSALIAIQWQENIIIDWLILNWDWEATNGLNLLTNGSEKSTNNTLNNISSYNNTRNGIFLWMWAEYNTIMNSQTWNNGQYGIEIYYAGNYNIINNSLSYNNDDYGIRFGNGSKYNTINNSQFFNNGIGGIFADFTTQQNVLNNVHLYNNTDYGLNFKRSSGNTLNNVYAYNNNIGINVTDVSCVNNTFNWDLILFANTWWDLNGTNASDEYLSTAGANSSLNWYAWSIETWNETMSCDWVTNPREDDMHPTWFLSGGILCSEGGDLSSWNSSINGLYIDYMFGSSISKQIAPVWYNSGSIENLDNQYDDEKYIWEVNPIIWTNPSYITFDIVETSGSFINLDPSTIYEITVDYQTWF